MGFLRLGIEVKVSERGKTLVVLFFEKKENVKWKS